MSITVLQFFLSLPRSMCSAVPFQDYLSSQHRNVFCSGIENSSIQSFLYVLIDRTDDFQRLFIGRPRSSVCLQILIVLSSAPSLNWCYYIFSSYHIFPSKHNFKLSTSCSLQHFAHTHQLLHLRKNIFCNQSLQYTAALDCMKGLIWKLYLATKQVFFLFCFGGFFLGGFFYDMKVEVC